MARKPMMAGNWKMNNAIGEAVVLTQEISNNWRKDWEDKVDVVICPPFVDLKPVKTVLEFDKTKIFVGAQTAAHKAAQKNWSHIYYPYYNVFCQTNVGAISGRPLSLFVRHLCNQANTVFHVGANSVRPLLLAHSVFTR